MKLTFIGFGAIAKAIAQGLKSQPEYELSAASPSLTPGETREGIKTYCDNKKAIVGAQMIILAVKPNQMASVLAEIAPSMQTDCCIISVASGLTLSWFAHQFKAPMAIIRAMPNIAASHGLAATPLICNKNTTTVHKQAAEQLFSCLGLTTWLEQEEHMDSFTALSGSGPAYVFLFIEAMIDAAVHLGLNDALAKSFTLQTLKGAIRLAETSDLSLTQLRTNVTSTKGTTAAALKVLYPLTKLIQEAMTAAVARSKELAHT
ncbi:MAG: pyrroline-5-carboxylate reductase [Legionella sp.]|nr:pyrroline-5-carboxylate reductase [Legionella sp.]